MPRHATSPTVKCPTCGQRGAWFETVYGPFCCHRCKLIDLGRWLGGQHIISEPLRPEHLESDAHPPGPLPDQGGSHPGGHRS